MAARCLSEAAFRGGTSLRSQSRILRMVTFAFKSNKVKNYSVTIQSGVSRNQKIQYWTARRSSAGAAGTRSRS